MENVLPAKGNQPKIRIDNYVAYWSCRLAKSGYYSGNPEQIMSARSDVVMHIIHYEIFDSDLNSAYRELNK